MSYIWHITIHTIVLIGVIHMKKKRETIYMGGELDAQHDIMPKYFEVFFNKSFLIFVLLLFVALLLFMRLNL